jgi:CRISPR system Cascade subunit CasE
MYRIPLDMHRLAGLEQQLKLPVVAGDTGYLVHCQLRGLFGELAPQPFAIDRIMRGRIETLAYGRHGAEDLRHHASAFADPLHHHACDWSGFAGKAMPESWPQQLRLGFMVRVCPVVRRSATGPQGESPGREMDAFLARVEQDPDARHSRYQIYIEWLGQALARSAGAELETARVEAFQLRRLLRRNARRLPTVVPPLKSSDRGASGRPDTTITGVLRVTDSERFSQLLARGIGRHRAFGFGMLLLRPVPLC